MANTAAIFKGTRTKLLTKDGLGLEAGQTVKVADGAGVGNIPVSDAQGVLTVQAGTTVITGKALTGLTPSIATPVATDTILQGFNKLSPIPEIFTDEKDPTGWVDANNITVTYDSTGKTITLTHSSGSIDGYYHGKKFSLTSPWVSTAHGATNGVYWLTISAVGAADWGTINVFPGFDQILVAYINYGATIKFAMRECHGLMGYRTHEELHKTIGAYRYSGGLVTAGTFALNTNTVAAVTPGVDAAVIADEDLKTTIAALTDGSTYTRVHIDTLNPVFTAGSTFPFPDDGTDIQYNQNPTSGTVLTPITVNTRWTNVYGCFAPATSSATSQAYRIIWLTGQQIYNTSAAAQAEDFRTLVLGNLVVLMPELVPFIRLTYRRVGSNLTRNAQFDVNPTYLLGSNLSLVSVSGLVPADHAGLTGRTVADSHPATAVSTNVTNFTQILTSSETDTQLALDKLSNPESYKYDPTFLVAAWTFSAPDFYITYPAATHKRGLHPRVLVQTDESGSYADAQVNVTVNTATGDVTIASRVAFDGRVVIS